MELQSVLAAHVDSTDLIKERADTQDPGTILTIVLGAPAVVGAVSALGAWLVRKNQSNVTIEDEDGKVIINNMASGDVAAAIQAVRSKMPPSK
jgi:hypothetical protein